MLVLGLQAQHPVFRHFTVDEGLPSNEVYHLFQDSKGFIWIATNMGVSRFDGISFRNFDKQDGLPENTVFEVYEDYKGRIWFVGFPCKLSYYEDGRIIEYKYNDVLERNTGSYALPVKFSFLVENGDLIKLGLTDEGLITIDNKGILSRLHPKGPESSAAHIFIMDSKALVSQGVAMNYYNIVIHFKDSSKFYRIENQTHKYTHRQLMALKYKSGHVVFSQNDLLATFKEGKLPQVRFFSFRIFGIYPDKLGNVWVATDKNGAYCFKSDSIQSDPIRRVLPGMSISSVCRDTENGLWFSTFNDGLYYLPTGDFQTFSDQDGLSDKAINTLSIWEDDLVLGSNDEYLNIISRGVISLLKLSETKNDRIQKLFVDQKNVLWIGTNEYLYSLDRFGNKRKHFNLKAWRKDYKLTNKESRKIFSIKTISQSRDGGIWLGESKNFSKFINDHIVYNSIEVDSIGLRTEALLEMNDGQLFIGALNGLWKFNNSGITDMSKNNSLLSRRITDIKVNGDKKQMFLGTKGSGLLVFDLKDSVVQITKSHGLSSNSVSSLLLLGNNLWVATNYGLNVFDVTKIGKKDFRIKSYFKNNGLVSNEINQIAGDDNNIYIATNQGLTVFNYKNYNPVLSSPPIYISAFSILKNDTIIRSGYKLRHYQNLITIKFVGISFREPENLRYKYRLSGMDTSWIFTGNREVEYAYLPPGEYKFEVLAVNSDGIISQKPAQIAFTVLPPFWKTWWFITLVILFIAALAYLYYLNRLKQLKKEHSLKNDLEWYRQQALAKQMEPHFVFNTLNSIQSFIIRNDRLSSTQYLSKFARLMRLILTSSQKQAVPLSDEISAITLYLELEALRFQRRFDFNINVDSTVDSTNCLIPAFLIQPFVENAIWHGIIGLKDNGRIDLSFSKYGNHITCIVEDNGIGRVKAAESRKAEKAKRESFGISLVESRLNLLNNLYDIDMKVEIIDLYNENNVPAGTRVMIDLPLFT